MIQGDHDALGYPQRPRQAQPRLVQYIPVSTKIDMTRYYMQGQRQIDSKQAQRHTG